MPRLSPPYPLTGLDRPTPLTRLIRALVGLTLAAGSALAFATVDLNKADQTALETVKGIGPKMSARILAERRAAPFKDWPDFMQRVSGIGQKTAVKMSTAGLTVNGAPYGSKAVGPANGNAKAQTNPSTPGQATASAPPIAYAPRPALLPPPTARPPAEARR